MLCRLLRPAGGVASPHHETGWDDEPTPLAWRATGGGPPAPSPARSLPAGASPPPGVTEAEIQARVQAAYRQGEAAGAQAATERLTGSLASLGQMAKELSSVGPRVRAEAELAVVQLSMAIARRVLHREIATDPQALAGVVKSACERMNARELNRLRAAPSDAAVLQEHRGRIGLPPGLEIAADPGLAPGSAVFETMRGEIDASVETQLDEIERGLADCLRRRG